MNLRNVLSARTGLSLLLLAMSVLAGCVSPHSRSAAGQCTRCREAWVVQPTGSADDFAASWSDPAHWLSVVSPLGDAPGERDLVRVAAWRGERQHQCASCLTGHTCQESGSGQTSECACAHCQHASAGCSVAGGPGLLTVAKDSK